MIQVSIYKDSILTNQGQFASQEEAEAWLSYHQQIESFGKNEVSEMRPVCVKEEVRGESQELVSDATFDRYGNEITPAVYKVIKDALISPAEYEDRKFIVVPAEYEVIIEDISQKLQQEAINAEALAFLASTDWMVVRAMERGESLSPEFKAERQAARDRIIK